MAKSTSKQTLLNSSDYKHILTYYGRPIPKSKSMLRKQAEGLLAGNLCRCIKSVGGPESRAVPVCTKSVIENKGYKRGKFTCKRKRSIQLSKSVKKRSI